MAPQTQVRRIVVQVDARDSDGKLRALQRGFAGLNQGIKGTTSAVTSFRNAFLALQGLNFAGFGIGSLTQTLDQVQKLNDRLKLTEGSAAGANLAFSQLVGVANDNRTSVTDLADVYARLNLSLRDTGISSKALIGLTDTLQKSFRISGSTAQEATATVIQLSQGLASGELRGQELRSVLEQNALVGELLAKRFGIARGELIKFSEKRGGIQTVEFLEAISANFSSINAQAANLAPTIGETLTANFNRLRETANRLNQEFLITRRVSDLINAGFANLDIAAAVIGIAAAFKAYTFSVSLATTATVAFNTSVVALVSSPIVGSVVRAGAALAGLAVSATAASVGIIAAVTGFTAALALSDEFRGFIKGTITDLADFLALSVRTKEYREEVLRQRNALKETREQTQGLVFSQTVLGQAFDKTFESIANGTKQTFVLADANKGLTTNYVEQREQITEYQKALNEFAKQLRGNSNAAFNYKATLSALNEEFLATRNLAAYNKGLRDLELFKLNQDFKEGAINLETYNKRLQEINFGKAINRAQELRNDLLDLNREFGMFGDVQAYSQRLNAIQIERVSKDFAEGRTNLLDFNRALTDRAIERYNIQLQKGSVTLQEYVAATEQLRIDQLNRSFRAGAIDVFEYNRQLTELGEKFNPSSALFTGTANYIRQAGTLSQNIANGITQTFGRLEEFFTDFTKTGRFNFREFAAGVIDDLNRIIVRALIIRPIAQGILGNIGGGAAVSTAGSTDLATGATANLAANGASFNGSKATFFARGGVVNKPTGFTFNGGKMGVMGEAGPEAILPLRRTASGDLGVKADATPANVFVNIINQSGNSVEQRESTNANGDRFIEVLVLSTVKEGISNGIFDKQLSQTFGLSRRGA
jgi:lambda family phage tail tape measure protein